MRGTAPEGVRWLTNLGAREKKPTRTEVNAETERSVDVGKELGKEDRQWLEAVELAVKCTRCREMYTLPRNGHKTTRGQWGHWQRELKL